MAATAALAIVRPCAANAACPSAAVANAEESCNAVSAILPCDAVAKSTLAAVAADPSPSPLISVAAVPAVSNVACGRGVPSTPSVTTTIPVPAGAGPAGPWIPWEPAAPAAPASPFGPWIP
ncbi:MAG: hypothetical protein WCS65_15715 [Verrucomicrobiae bacterium]